MTFLAQFRIGKIDFFFGRGHVVLEGIRLDCIEIKNTADEEIEYIEVNCLDDEGYMRGDLAEATLKWMYSKAKEPYVPHEPYKTWFATVVRVFVEATTEKGKV